jgi:hypothetical protein
VQVSEFLEHLRASGELAAFQDDEGSTHADGGQGGANGKQEGWGQRAKEVDEAEDEYEKWYVGLLWP